MVFNSFLPFIDMRCFVAIDVDEGLKGKIAALQKQLNGDVKLVEPENLHFTLKFLGEADEKVIADASARLKNVISSFKLFDAHVKGMGAFPSLNYIHVVWLGCPDIFSMQGAVEEALSSLFKKEKPVPHMTIARVRSPKGLLEIKDFVSRNVNVEVGTMAVDKIKLKKSTVTKSGPIYEDIAVFDLHDI